MVYKGVDSAGEEVWRGDLLFGEEDLVEEFFDCFAEIVFTFPQGKADVEEFEIGDHLGEESFLVCRREVIDA